MGALSQRVFQTIAAAANDMAAVFADDTPELTSLLVVWALQVGIRFPLLWQHLSTQWQISTVIAGRPYNPDGAYLSSGHWGLCQWQTGEGWWYGERLLGSLIRRRGHIKAASGLRMNRRRGGARCWSSGTRCRPSRRPRAWPARCTAAAWRPRTAGACRPRTLSRSRPRSCASSGPPATRSVMPNPICPRCSKAMEFIDSSHWTALALIRLIVCDSVFFASSLNSGGQCWENRQRSCV